MDGKRLPPASWGPAVLLLCDGVERMAGKCQRIIHLGIKRRLHAHVLRPPSLRCASVAKTRTGLAHNRLGVLKW